MGKINNKKIVNNHISNKKTKVLFVIPSLSWGGAERALSILLEYLNRNKIQPFCIFNDSRRAYKIPDDVKVYCLDLPGTDSLLKKIIYSIKRIIKIKKIIRIEKPDVVFSFLNTVNLMVIFTRLSLKGFKNKIKLIVSEHTTPSVELKGKLYRTKKFLIKNLYRKADKIIAVSEGVKKDLVVNFKLPEEKIEVIYNPLDIERIKELSKEELIEHHWFNDNVPIIINVGSLNKPKAQEYLLKAFKLVREKIDCRLVILGEGEKENELKQLSIDLGISNDVAFLGFQNNPFRFIGRSSVFVLSSIWEGFPSVLVEAMACGVPVISTRCQSGPEEIITDSVNGLLVPVKDGEKLAEAIFKVITNPDLSASMASVAKATVSRYDVKNVIINYERLLISTVEKKL